MPNPHPNAEEAGLYVLDLLDPEAKRAFEAELDTSPDLRQHVADLSANLEALAEAVPPVQPPARIWTAISERTFPAAVRPSTTSGWAAVRAMILQWLTNGWAVAAAVAVAFVTHLLLDPPMAPPMRVTSVDPASAGVPGSTHARPTGRGSEAAVAGGGSRGAGVERNAGGRNGVSGATGAGAASVARLEQEEARLQDRVRRLSEQVALLTRVLTQQTVLPAGASRLQVFRLISTNAALENLDVLSPDPRRALAANPGGGGGVAGPGTGAGQPPVSAGSSGSTGADASAGGVADAGTGAGTGSGSGGVEASSPDVALALALAAARQMAATAAPTGDDLPNAGFGPSRTAVPQESLTAGAPPTSLVPTEEAPVASGEGAMSRESIRVIDLASEAAVFAGGTGTGMSEAGAVKDAGFLPSVDGSAFGAFSPDTGQGAVAFRVPAAVGENGVLQLWVTDAQTGLVQSLGMTPLTPSVPVPQVMVMRFSVDGAAFTTPTFMITREPLGGSATPTGPVVALPPSAAPVPAP